MARPFLTEGDVPREIWRASWQLYDQCLSQCATTAFNTETDCAKRCPPPADPKPCTLCITAVGPAHFQCVEACTLAHQDRLYQWKCKPVKDAEADARMGVAAAELGLKKAEQELSSAWAKLAADLFILMACAAVPPPADVGCVLGAIANYNADAGRRNAARTGLQQAELELERSRLRLANAQKAVIQCEGGTP